MRRVKDLAGYAVQLTRDEGLGTMLVRGAGFVRRRFFGKRARYLPTKKVLQAQRAECAAAPGGLPSISILTPLYNTPEKYLREFLDSFVNQTAPNGQLVLADASDPDHAEVGAIVREYQAKNQRIVYKKIENQGIAANTNAAAALAEGDYLALADHDDILAPHAMYTMGKAILQLRQQGLADDFLYSDEALFEKSIRRTMPRITCCAAITSVIWRCSAAVCIRSWAASGRSATAARTMTCSCGWRSAPAAQPMCPRCCIIGGSMPGLLLAGPMLNPMWLTEPKKPWQITWPAPAAGARWRMACTPAPTG